MLNYLVVFTALHQKLHGKSFVHMYTTLFFYELNIQNKTSYHFKYYDKL